LVLDLAKESFDDLKPLKRVDSAQAIVRNGPAI
jgi:hypothetical protein